MVEKKENKLYLIINWNWECVSFHVKNKKERKRWNLLFEILLFLDIVNLLDLNS